MIKIENLTECEVELKECPFCESKNLKIDWFKTLANDFYVVISCLNCKINAMFKWHDEYIKKCPDILIALSIRSWNKRPESPVIFPENQGGPKVNLTLPKPAKERS